MRRDFVLSDLSVLGLGKYNFSAVLLDCTHAVLTRYLLGRLHHYRCTESPLKRYIARSLLALR